MKIKTLKTKQLVALALALFMVVPMLFATVPFTKAAQTGGPALLDIVPTGAGAATVGSTTYIPVQGVGTTFSVDVRVDNYASLNIGGTNNGVSGASYIVTWNPAVLTFESYTDGAWLPDQSNAGDLSTNTANGQLTIGQIAFNTGNAMATADNSAGSVSATIEFQVASAGTTAITLSPQTGVPYLVAPETVGGLTSGHAITGTTTVNALYNPLTTISLYQHGTSSNSFQFGAGVDPIGQTFQVDIYINNPLAVPIWGWNVGLTWNPAAVQLTSITEGTYLSSSNLNNQQGASTIFVPGYINNNLGTIPQGISDVYLNYVTQNAPSGVLATLTFTVINFASSPIDLVQGIQNAAGTYMTLEGFTENTGTTPPTYTPTPITPAPVLNNFQYITNAPQAPTSPVAKITNTDSSTTYTNGQALTPAFAVSTPFTFHLSAVNSVPGNDVIPNALDTSYPSYPVTGYAWTYTVSSGGPALSIANPTNTETLSFTTPTTGVSGVVTYTIQLVVSTASNPNDASYTPTSTPVTFSFQVSGSITPTTAGALLDIYVVNPTTVTTTNPLYSPDGNNGNPLAYGTSAYTPNAYSDAFGPQALMTLDGLVTYNGAPVANAEVTFQITSNTGASMGTLTAMTNENGIATTSYRLPWYDGSYTSGPVSEFGIWSVTGSAEVQQTIVTDNMPFDFGDIISITGVTVTSNPVPRSTPTVPSSNSFTVSLAGISAQTQNYWMSYTVVDAGSVPVAQGVVQGTMPAATYTDTTGTLVVTPSTSSTGATFVIPSYAFVGGATIYVNIYNANPVTSQSTAVAYCPQATATFTINIPIGE